MSHRPSSLFVVTLLFACCASPVPSSAPDGAVVELYAVKDILFAAEPSQRIASEDLVVVLRDATDRDRWRDGATIECEDSGILRVVATPRMQALVTNVLKDLRSTQRAGGADHPTCNDGAPCVRGAGSATIRPLASAA